MSVVFNKVICISIDDIDSKSNINSEEKTGTIRLSIIVYFFFLFQWTTKPYSIGLITFHSPIFVCMQHLLRITVINGFITRYMFKSPQSSSHPSFLQALWHWQWMWITWASNLFFVVVVFRLNGHCFNAMNIIESAWPLSIGKLTYVVYFVVASEIDCREIDWMFRTF